MKALIVDDDAAGFREGNAGRDSGAGLSLAMSS
jgi:hypothetical protein